MPCWFKLSRTKHFKLKRVCKNFIGSLFGLENYLKKSFYHAYRDDDTIWTKSYSVSDPFQKSFSCEENGFHDDTFNNIDNESEYSLSSNGEAINFNKVSSHTHICRIIN